MKKKNGMWRSLTLEIYFNVWKAALSFEENCYYKHKMSISPLHFFLKIAAGTKIWQSRCRTGPQLARHRELEESCIKWEQVSLTAVRCQMAVHISSLPFASPDSIWCSVFVALSASLSVPSLVSPSEVDGKAPLFGSSPARPVILLCCPLFCRSVKVQGSDFIRAG